MFTPIIPSSGLTGWRFLQRTYDSQLANFSNSAQITRNTEYFLENIGKVTSAEELTSDRRLLEVALGAFGIQDDIDNRFFIRKILEEGTTANDSLANRFSDNRYKEFSAAFGLGPGETRQIGSEGFAENMVARFQANSFEVSTGQQDETMRIALYAQRVLVDLATPPQKTQARLDAEAVAQAVSDFAAEASEDIEYFERNIGLIATPEDLLNDERLLKVALGAFGLEEDYQAIVDFEPSGDEAVSPEWTKIKEVLEEGSISVVARANELDNPAYAELSRAFGFGVAEDFRANNFGFADEITDLYIQRSFEVPEGITLSEPVVVKNGSVELEPFRSDDMSNDAKWFTVMGEPPLRTLFETALNLPTEFGQADINQQLAVFKERARKTFGSDQVNQFSDPEKLDQLITQFVVRSQISSFNSGASSASIALTLLQS
ncbi:DUF1217 domain-containing protein [Roseobacter sinensis]|uniref:DUF1217 domain-containing protein n=1 Tax=Roseobacter sinensis TaxID=2931391 RepID=A0ABT3B8K2_9RHOB|nr:DUF1217 domain-containing protein [Roseobacter sp. WL0113]MCV3269897.1 DUF1217 domain-containing protein [Roseobacter sp. WL0113]